MADTGDIIEWRQLKLDHIPVSRLYRCVICNDQKRTPSD